MRKNHPHDEPSSRFEVVIEKLVFGGEGLGRHEGKVVFVPFTAPGDRAEVRAIERKKNFIRAEAVRILQPGPGRREPSCPHFLRCGGCQWQHMDYQLQVDTKRSILQELFYHRIPATRGLNVSMEPSPLEYGYRSRARVQLRGQGAGAHAGFYRYHSRSVEDVALCPLFRPDLNRALQEVRRTHLAGEFGAPDQEIDLACAEDGRWACSLALKGDPPSESGAGEPLNRSIGEFEYTVAPAAFFQANDALLSRLIAIVQELASGGGSALDLYSGVGFFSLPLAGRYRGVVAVEEAPLAHYLCGLNIARARKENVRAVCAEVRGWMEAAGSLAPPAFDLILLDPPRAGAGPEVMRQVVLWAPETVLYVSCDPQTLIRDLEPVCSGGYTIDAIVGLDMFPQTYHIETIVRLKRS